MKIVLILKTILPSVIAWILFNQYKVQAQVIPDKTLPVNSIVTPDGNTLIIDGGTTRKNNLFHSFEFFSIFKGQNAIFNNSGAIQNIFSRVTGGSVSNIDGIISANGTANLFFLNPNGIIFGPNSALNIGGSFYATTANSITFADGSKFGVNTTEGSSLLTIAIPIGLDFSTSSGSILVRNTGHQVISSPNGAFPTIRNNTPPGLQVTSGKTLAFLGGDIFLDGGILTVNSGNLLIGSFKSGTLNIFDSSGQLSINYNSNFQLGNIELSNQSLVNGVGFGLNTITFFGNNILLQDTSNISTLNLGNIADQKIKLIASSIVFNGAILGKTKSGIISETLGGGKGADINISTNNLSIEEGAGIATATYGTGNGGNITIQADGKIDILPPNNQASSFVGNIATTTFGEGKGGDVNLKARQMLIANGGNIGTVTFANGQGGNAFINAEELQLEGIEPTFGPSAINAATFSMGDAGNLTINAKNIIIREGARIDTATLSSGDAGNLTINVSESIEVTGKNTNSSNPSMIDSSANILDINLQNLYNLPKLPSGRSGNLTINTPYLKISDEAQISVLNAGTGNAGILQINADSIVLNNQGEITAATQSGEGGNISINSAALQLDHSKITATAGGAGNGGNINIDTTLFTLTNNSAITANAVQGRGGNINIDTQGFFLSRDSKITASSEFGVEGTVTINSNIFEVNPTEIKIPSDISFENVAATSCLNNSQTYSFSTTGRGGTRSTPGNGVQRYTLEDLIPMGQAVGLVRQPDGRLKLVGCEEL